MNGDTVFAECTSPSVGIERGNILDSQMQASTGNASLVRLNGESAWCPVREGLGEYIQVKSNNILNAIYREDVTRWREDIENTSWKVLAYGIYSRVVDVSEIERVSAANE